MVDMIGAIDPWRDLMASYVHLAPEGYRITSEVFTEKVWQQACSDRTMASVGGTQNQHFTWR